MNYENAEEIALQVLSVDNKHSDAWRVLAHVYETTKQAEKLLQAIYQVIRLVVKKRQLPNHLVFQRALAKLWLDDMQGFHADVKLLEGRKRPPQFFLNRLREEEAQHFTERRKC